MFDVENAENECDGDECYFCERAAVDTIFGEDVNPDLKGQNLPVCDNRLCIAEYR